MPHTQPSSPDTGRIPTLDGWRCLAISLVLFSHIWTWLGLGTDRLARALHYPGIAVHIAHSGRAGVGVFFCLSGFLITRRLIDDGFNLRQFYARRALRILPAALVYLAFVTALGACGFLPVSSREVMASLFFYRNFFDKAAWFTGHFWSLSIEEQFYLVWPAALAIAGARLCRTFGVVCILMIVIWRIANWPLEGFVYFHTDMRLDAVLCGAVMALSWPAFSRVIVIPRFPTVSILAAVTGFFVVDLFTDQLRGTGDLLQAMLVCFLISLTVTTPGHSLSRLLEMPMLQKTGKMSYSIYLWQQFFLQPGTGSHWQLPLRLAGIAIFAWMSYDFVERRLTAAVRNMLERTRERKPGFGLPVPAKNPIAARDQILVPEVPAH